MSVRVALIGCGAAARRLHLPGFRDAGADVVAFASRTRASAEAAATEWGSGLVLDDWRKALDPAVADAVAICTPNALHAEAAIAAARAGLHVLVEKPIAVTLTEADAMIAAAAGAGTVLMVAHNARFTPPVAAVRAAVAAGRVGAVREVRAVLRNQGPEAWAPGADWFTDPALAGGGALLDLGVHLADVVRALTGGEPAEVVAVTRPAPPSERAAHALVSLDDGALATLHVGWDAPAPEFSLTVSGETAIAHADARGPVLLRPGAEPEPLEPPAPDDPWAAFARACAGAEPPAVTGADGRAALALVLAAARAASSGAREPVGRR